MTSPSLLVVDNWIDSSAKKAPAQPFMGPAYTARRYRYVTAKELKPAFQQLFAHLNIRDVDAIESLSSQKVHEVALKEFVKKLPRLAPAPKADSLGRALRRYYAAQIITDVLQDPLDQSTQYPPVVKDILRDGADGLFELGRVQFNCLAELARELADWVEARGYQRVVLVESPLGNSIPVASIRETMIAREIVAEVVEWGCPRNDRAREGTTVRQSAQMVAAFPVVSNADIVLFVDDALTGSRFKKMARALRTAVGVQRFAGIAMKFEFDPRAGAKPFAAQDLAWVDEWARAMGLPRGVVKVPPIPLFRIDGGRPVYFESAIAWGDVDLVAGKRKANLIFNFIDRYQAIATEFASDNPDYRKILERELWSKDVTGRKFLASPGLLGSEPNKAVEARIG